MGFVGIDPTRMRDLASRSDSISQDVARLAQHAATIISNHQLDDFVGELGSLLEETHTGMGNLSRLATTKAADIERVANGDYRSLTGSVIQEGCGGLCGFDWDELLAQLETRDQRLRRALNNVRGNINHGDDLPMSAYELRGVRDRLDKLSDADRAWVLSQLTDEEIQRLFYNARTDHGVWPWSWGDEEREDLDRLLDCLPDDERIRFALEAAKAQAIDNVGIQETMDTLANSDEFKALDRDQQIAILAQAANYPNYGSILYLQRLAGKPWAVESSLEDFQRSAKLVADLAQDNGGDTAIQLNTLDAILDDDSNLVLVWDPTMEEGHFGSASGTTLRLNPAYLDAGNGSVEQSVPRGVSKEETLHLVRRTTAHEVNHFITGGTLGGTYSEFMNEYRASYVGLQAELGRPPTRKEMVDRVKWLFDPDSGYIDIRSALKNPGEAKQIAEFVSDLLGEEVTPEDLRDQLDGGAQDDGRSAPAPVSVDGGPNSIDNSPWP